MVRNALKSNSAERLQPIPDQALVSYSSIAAARGVLEFVKRHFARDVFEMPEEVSVGVSADADSDFAGRQAVQVAFCRLVRRGGHDRVKSLLGIHVLPGAGRPERAGLFHVHRRDEIAEERRERALAIPIENGFIAAPAACRNRNFFRQAAAYPLLHARICGAEDFDFVRAEPRELKTAVAACDDVLNVVRLRLESPV